MGNGFHHHNHHHHHHHHHHHQESFYSNKNTFLPLLCRLSIRDVRLGDYRDRSTTPSSSSLSEDPSSPKVSCMGHVKKNHHQFIDFSTPYRLTAPAGASTTSGAVAVVKSSKPSTNRGPFKYAKLKRFFSGKNLLTAAAGTTATATTTTTTSTTAGSQFGRSRSCREIVMRRSGSKRSSKINNDDGGDHHRIDSNSKNLNISEMDPPLPVPKKAPQPPSETNNLWKRRSGGLTLRSLQIEQIHVPNNKNNMQDDQPAATTV